MCCSPSISSIASSNSHINDGTIGARISGGGGRAGKGVESQRPGFGTGQCDTTGPKDYRESRDDRAGRTNGWPWLLATDVDQCRAPLLRISRQNEYGFTAEYGYRVLTTPTNDQHDGQKTDSKRGHESERHMRPPTPFSSSPRRPILLAPSMPPFTGLTLPL